MQVNKVLIAVHGDDSDDQALWLAHTMTHDSKGKIYVLYVIEVQRSLPLDADVGAENIKGEQVLQHMERMARQHHRTVEGEILQARDAGPAVVQEAVGRDVEAIIITAPYKRHHGVFSLGQAVPYILKNAPCPVLLVRGGMEVDGTGAPSPSHQ